jgi:hypothetical protein
MNPLFSVGEVVILQSVSRPELNGECTVLERVAPGQMAKCGLINNLHGYGYKTTIKNISDSIHWAESALRKKHQPGEQSFTQLMQTLKSPVSV